MAWKLFVTFLGLNKNWSLLKYLHAALLEYEKNIQFDNFGLKNLLAEHFWFFTIKLLHMRNIFAADFFCVIRHK